MKLRGIYMKHTQTHWETSHWVKAQNMWKWIHQRRWWIWGSLYGRNYGKWYRKQDQVRLPDINGIPCNLVERDNTGILEREKYTCRCSQSEFWVYGGEQLHRNNYTQVRHTRVLRIYRTHKCHKPAHLGGNERQEELCSSVVWPSQCIWICAQSADRVSNGVIPYTGEVPGDCQELLWRDEDPVHGRWLQE